ncbi:glycosyltransferase family 4 protein [Salinimicrobium sediminilitoris]|uniref:glycosyltransferase family 4 protein n=1 Tax=Salinimicrobium sediminilitoris TaxID=2876715 RepID=UPI001E3F278B|nr:glycosyltransferase family 4 protein [Salinimicrobium sediminilitoris]MCC8358536.1 glycosyltransferase family 4 protein [Salinimicrobium sediminilitoris]
MIKKKNIGIICNYKLNPKRIGGMDRFFQAYNKQLLQKGYKPTWFFSGGEHFDFYSGFELYIAGKNESVETYVLHYLEKNQGFDIVVTHFLTLCTPFYKELKKRSQPYIIAVDHNPRPPGGFPLKKRLKNKVRGKLFSQLIDCFVGVSKYTVDCILKDYGSNLREKTKVIYNGIDTSVYLKRTEENHSRFIVASHLRESKGIQDLIEAVKLLPIEVRNTVRIDIFGEGPMEGNLKEMVEAFGLREQFSFKGSSPHLPQLFGHYSYLLQPTYMECFSLSILESLAANVPVITTPVGGNPEIISHGRNGFIFPTGNIQELSDLLQKILCREIEISSDVNRLVEEDYNLDKMLENHLKLLPCT